MKRGHKYLVRLPKKILECEYLATFETLEEAQAARDRELKRAELAQSKPKVEGLTNEYQGKTVDDLWSDAYSAQVVAEKREALRQAQRITIPGPNQAFGVAWLSDFHVGSDETDYRSLRRDFEIVRDTPRLYAEFHGDGTDNWINAKLSHLQRGQALPFDGEVRLFADLMAMLHDKWIAIVCGNHDNWTRKLAGIDQIRQALDGATVLYDTDEVCFVLAHGENSYRVKMRHKWKYSSIFNRTHSIEVGWVRGGYDFDIGVGGHTHIGTYDRSFHRHGKRRHAILTGTYKVIGGAFGRQIGVAKSQNRGCGASIFYPDGRYAFFDDLDTAAEFLKYLNR
jgi:hypothetical protein